MASLVAFLSNKGVSALLGVKVKRSYTLTPKPIGADNFCNSFITSINP